MLRMLYKGEPFRWTVKWDGIYQKMVSTMGTEDLPRARNPSPSSGRRRSTS